MRPLASKGFDPFSGRMRRLAAARRAAARPGKYLSLTKAD
jgi:hypothetical protein